MNSGNNILFSKIKSFIRRFYLNRLIRGSIFLFSSLLIFFLLLSITEFFSYFDSAVRYFLFYGYLFVHLLVLVFYVIIPFLKINGITRIISYEQSAKLIGKHFPEIKDKLLNTLQLIDKKNEGTELSLLSAAIQKRTDELKTFKFSRAVNLKVNRRYLVYFIVPASVVVFILFASPSLILEPTKRIIDYSGEYEKPLPYQLHVVNNELSALQGEDFKLEVKVEGNSVPSNVYINFQNSKIPLKKNDNRSFYYEFKNLQKSIPFNLFTEEFTDKEYLLSVLLKPSITNFKIDLDYPAYTSKHDESISNNGNLTIPEGTRVNWKYYSMNTDSVQFITADKSYKLTNSDNQFSFSKTFYQDLYYGVAMMNNQVYYNDTLNYKINVVKDEYPAIFIEQFKDSILNTQLYFTGNISDDYGFKDLQFNYYFVEDSTSFNNSNDGTNIPIDIVSTKQQFYYSFDFSEININPGEEIIYFFTVRDNDAIHRFKSTSSRKFSYKKETEEEIEQKSDSFTDQIKSSLEESLNKVSELKKEMNDLKKSLIEKRNIDWEDKEKIEKLIEKQNALEEQMMDVKDLQEQKSAFDENVTEQDESLLEKQRQLEELFEKIFTDDMKKQMDELKDLLEKFNNKNQLDQKLDDMKMSNDELEKQLERQLELFKNFELQQKLQSTMDKLDQMKKEQEQLSIQNENQTEPNEDILEKQKELQKDFENLKEDIDEIEKKNSELEQPYNMEDMEEEQENVENNMEESMQELQKGNNSKSSKSQKQSAQQMQKMSNKMNSMMNSMQQQSASEDLGKLRELLENIVNVSFEQEKLMNKFNGINRNSPNYVKLVSQQSDIKDDIQMIEDTLFKISKRQAQIEPIVNKKIGEVDMNLEQALHQAEQRRLSAAKTRQQYVMTGLNDLALLLAESIESMKQQQGMGMGKGKPSQSNPSPSQMPSLMQMQQQLNQQIQQLKQQMKNGKMPSQQSGDGQKSVSEQLARMAAEQASIRRKLQELSEKYDSEGEFGLSKMLKEAAKKMEQTETDLVNKVISQQTLNRQKEIETRMLESEKAERKQEKEKKRVSEEAKSEVFGNKSLFFKYNTIKKNKEYELLRTVSPKLNTYYKKKVKQYFNNIEE